MLHKLILRYSYISNILKEKYSHEKSVYYMNDLKKKLHMSYINRYMLWNFTKNIQKKKNEENITSTSSQLWKMKQKQNLTGSQNYIMMRHITSYTEKDALLLYQFFMLVFVLLYFYKHKMVLFLYIFCCCFFYINFL